jgi:hypothetical protein
VQISFCAVLGDRRHVTAFDATHGMGIKSQLRVYMPHAATSYEPGEARFYSLAGVTVPKACSLAANHQEAARGRRWQEYHDLTVKMVARGRQAVEGAGELSVSQLDGKGINTLPAKKQKVGGGSSSGKASRCIDSYFQPVSARGSAIPGGAGAVATTDSRGSVAQEGGPEGGLGKRLFGEEEYEEVEEEEEFELAMLRGAAVAQQQQEEAAEEAEAEIADAENKCEHSHLSLPYKL